MRYRLDRERVARGGVRSVRGGLLASLVSRRICVRVALGWAIVAPGWFDETSSAQLRTGRSTQRQIPAVQQAGSVVPKPILVDPAIESLPRYGEELRQSNEGRLNDESSTEERLPQIPAVRQKVVGGERRPGVISVAPAVFQDVPATVASKPTAAVSQASGYAIKRVTPVRSAGRVRAVGTGSAVDASVVGSQVVDSQVIDSSIIEGEFHEPMMQGEYVGDGVVVEDPTYACEDGACGPDYPTMNIEIAFKPLFGMDRFSARVEAATFWGSSQGVPSLVRSDEIGIPGSVDYFGGTQDWNQSVQGIRGEFGWQFGSGMCDTLQFRFFDAGAQSLTFDSPVAGVPSIVRPYQTPVPLAQSAVSVKEPGISNGAVLAHGTSDVYGGDLLFRRIWKQSCDTKTEWLAGYQQARLNDSIDVHSTTFPIGTTNRLELRDQFRTNNAFHGAALGVSRMITSPRWSLQGMFKLGLGNMERTVTISGFQRVNNAVPTTNGLLARSTNNGLYQTDTFVVLPEANVTVGYRLTQHLEATLGYNYLGLPKVARAGEQIDTVSNLDNVNPARPAFSLQESNYSLHSLNYGLQYRY